MTPSASEPTTAATIERSETVSERRRGDRALGIERAHLDDAGLGRRAPAGVGDGAQRRRADAIDLGRAADGRRELDEPARGLTEQDHAGLRRDRVDLERDHRGRCHRGAAGSARRGATCRRARSRAASRSCAAWSARHRARREPAGSGSFSSVVELADVIGERERRLLGRLLELGPRLLDRRDAGVGRLATRELADERRALAAVPRIGRHLADRERLAGLGRAGGLAEQTVARRAQTALSQPAISACAFFRSCAGR